MIEEGRRVLLLMLDPIGLTALVLFSFSLLGLRRRTALGVRWLQATFALVFCFIASPYAANLLLGWLEARANDLAICPAPPPASVFVTLAGGAKRAASSPEDIAQMELPTFRRTVAAVHWVRQTPDSLLLLSGGGGGHAAREADLMATLATALGVPAERIIKERDSKTTFENARNSVPMLARLSGRPVYLVTSAVHMRRASAAFLAAGQHICPLPVDFQRMQPEGFDAIIPTISALQKTANGLREVVAYELYRWRIWLHRSEADAL